MLKKQVKVPPLNYAEKFRQSQTNLGAGGGQGARVAAPCMTRHVIGASGKPEASILPGFKK